MFFTGAEVLNPYPFVKRVCNAKASNGDKMLH